MNRLMDAAYGAGFLLILTAALLADGLAEITGGFYILGGMIAAAGILVFIGNRIEVSLEQRQRQRERRQAHDGKRTPDGY